MSATLTSVIAGMPAFAGRPLSIRPRARCSESTIRMLDPEIREREWIVNPIGTIEVYFDAEIPEGTIQIDGVSITVDELRAAIAERKP